MTLTRNAALLLTILCAFSYYNRVKCFVPAKIMTDVVFKVGSLIDLGQTGQTFPHEEIVRIGTYRAIVNYFYDQPNGSRLINLSKRDTYVENIDSLYFDYYNRSSCDLPIETIMRFELKPNVAIVDFDPKTKDMPHAHFDAETFSESNARIISFYDSIISTINAKQYFTARALTGKILHTIQDFYSHSNWVEMGRTEINKEIGSRNFSTIPIISKNENKTCLDNCTVTKRSCGTGVTLFVSFLNLLGFSLVSCPITYYECSGNIVKLSELVSGYYSGQKLDDGSEVNKPLAIDKCSHGGILDKTSVVPAQGI